MKRSISYGTNLATFNRTLNTFRVTSLSGSANSAKKAEQCPDYLCLRDQPRNAEPATVRVQMHHPVAMCLRS